MSNRKPFLAIGAITITALITSAHAQQSTAEVYGQIGLGLTTRNGVLTVAKTDLADNQIATSYIGFRGNEDLGGGWKAVYRLEGSVAVDSGLMGATAANISRVFNRQSFVGIDFGSAGTLTLGRQFHAATDRFSRTLDPQNAAGSLSVIPVGLFGVNRFVGNDTRVDNSIKYRVAGAAGFEGGVSYGISEDVMGISYSADIAQLTPNYQIGATFVSFSAPTVIATTGVRPEHQVWTVGGNAPVGPVKLWVTFLGSKLDATVAGRATQENKVMTLGVTYRPAATDFKFVYYHDQGTALNGIVGRDGNKDTLVASAEYYLSKRTSLYGAIYENRFTDGYKLEAVNLSALGRDPNSDAVQGISLGIRHTF